LFGDASRSSASDRVTIKQPSRAAHLLFDDALRSSASDRVTNAPHVGQRAAIATPETLKGPQGPFERGP